ncbi:MAG TPA: ATP-dependent protease [Candidatus Latescibacteria bacterium]|nr:ATP-dependent protease [Gemmatimonadota bacterium]HCR19223.1 ATP-dependent protease [Candidatus Latescibacterota bacterium]
MNKQFELPLFPLEMVMFPQRNVPLHIFEERYKEMIAGCLEDESEFGIVSGRDDAFQTIGCSAKIASLVNQFPDGRMNIVIRGRRRFRVLERIDIHSYISGVVEEIPDELGEADPNLVAKVKALYQEAVKLSLGWHVPDKSTDTDAGELSYSVAASLNLPLKEQQDLLEMRSPRDRLSRVEGVLENALDSVREVKRRSGSNGHLA